MSDSQRLSRQRRRQNRVRAVVHGTAERPRLSVHVSLRHVTAQLINDDAGTTLVYATSAGRGEALPLSAKAEQVGTAIGQKARTAKLNQAVFDRGARRYHGRVAKLADAARQAGLEF